MSAHLIDGQFQSDKYPTTPRGLVPLKTTDKAAQDLLWHYATRHAAIDAEFADDLKKALMLAGYDPGASKLDEAGREKLRDQLKVLDDGIAAIHQARKPFDDAIMALDTQKQQLLDDHDADVAGTCEGCNTLLLAGDKGHDCNDGPVLCEACAPTWNDLRKQYDDMKAKGEFLDAFESHTAAHEADAHVAAQVAAGKGDEKNVWTL